MYLICKQFPNSLPLSDGGIRVWANKVVGLRGWFDEVATLPDEFLDAWIVLRELDGVSGQDFVQRDGNYVGV